MICCSATMSVISIAKVSASLLLYINEAGGHSRERVCESDRDSERGERGGVKGERREVRIEGRGERREVRREGRGERREGRGERGEGENVIQR